MITIGITGTLGAGKGTIVDYLVKNRGFVHYSVPIKGSCLEGLDATFAIMQMPPGIPVATVAINGAQNAAILAMQMLALADDTLMQKLVAYKAGLKKKIVKANEDLAKLEYKFKC